MLLSMLPMQVFSSSLPERIGEFIEQFNLASARQIFDIRVIEADFPTRLISPEFMLPQSANYPLKDMQLLYKLADSCTGKLPLSPLVTEPLVFVRAMCRGTPISERWFARTGMIHPGGGSYAARYVRANPETFPVLQHYMHIQERPLADTGSLLGTLQRMDVSAVFALLAGEQIFLDHDMLWLRRGNRYYVYPDSIWAANLDKAKLSMSVYQKGQSCLVRRGNVCLQAVNEENFFKQLMLALVLVNIALVIGWLTYRWTVKRRELKARMLVLQILTHELRTPIASLSMTVEGFRREFDKLPETVYDEFRRLCEDTRRLRQLAEASKDYLQSDNQSLTTDWIPSVRDWLEYRFDECSKPVSVKIEEDIAAKVNIYWLGTCLDNLVNNAIKYGAEPIQVVVTTQKDRIKFKVIDQGSLSKKDWKRLKQPFVSKAGLGLGLTIVESMVRRMGGSMSLEGPPTTFTLEIPCETDIATH